MLLIIPTLTHHFTEIFSFHLNGFTFSMRWYYWIKAKLYWSRIEYKSFPICCRHFLYRFSEILFHSYEMIPNSLIWCVNSAPCGWLLLRNVFIIRTNLFGSLRIVCVEIGASINSNACKCVAFGAHYHELR